MKNKYIHFTLEGFLKNLLCYLLMVIVFGGSGFMMITTLADHPPSRIITPVLLLIALSWCLLPLGIFTLNFLKKMRCMFQHAAILSCRGIKFTGEKEILWTDIKTVSYHYDDGEISSDTLVLAYKTGGYRYFDISETNICNEYPAHRAEVLNMILSCI